MDHLLAQKFQYWMSLIFTKISVLALKYQSLVDHIECIVMDTSCNIHNRDHSLNFTIDRYKMKAKLGMRKVRSWKWMAFTNAARKDGLVLYHWRRAADESKDYPFARFNKKLEIPSFR